MTGLPRAAVFLEYFPPYMGSDRRIFELCRTGKGMVDYLIIATPPLRFVAGKGDSAEASKRLARPRTDEWLQVGELRGCKLGLPAALQAAWKCGLVVGYAISAIWFFLRSLVLVRKSGARVIVVAHPSYLCGMIGVLVARVLGRPILLDCPDVWTPMAQQVMGLGVSSPRLRVLSAIESRIVRSADAVIAATPYIREYFVKRGVPRARISVLPNGVDTDVFSPSSKVSIPLNQGEIRKQTIIFVGRLERWIGFEALVEAARSVVAQRPNASFLIVGDGTMKGTFEKMVVQEGLRDHFNFLGFQPEGAVPGLISGSDVAISLFSNDEVSQASLPLKLFEYMSSGKPVVATAQHGVVDTIKDQNVMILARPTDSAGLASSMLKLLENPETANYMGQRARAMVVTRFSWKSLSKKFEEMCILLGHSFN